ncbi:MAG: winged helix-turn-helix domain-containing protein [Acidimicrobiia bacterium]
MTTALVVCGDTTERRRLVAVMRSGDMDVVTARSNVPASSILHRRTIDVVLLAAAGSDPVSVVRDLRSRTGRPLIAVSAPVNELNTVALLDAGADDVVYEPVGAEELLARVRALMRRSIRGNEGDFAPIVTDDFTLYLADRRLVRASGTEVTFSPTEWRLIEVLVQRAGHLVMREDALAEVWGPSRADKTQYLRVYMTAIRRKIEPVPAHPRYFLTVPGLGLRFVPQPTTERHSAS